MARGEKLAKAMASGTVPQGGDGDLFQSFILRMERHKGAASDDEVVRSVVGLMNAMQDFGCREA